MDEGRSEMNEHHKYVHKLMVTPQGFRYVVMFNDRPMYLTVRGIAEKNGKLFFTGSNPFGTTVALQ
jgi:hypothetical protein